MFAHRVLFMFFLCVCSFHIFWRVCSSHNICACNQNCLFCMQLTFENVLLLLAQVLQISRATSEKCQIARVLLVAQNWSNSLTKRFQQSFFHFLLKFFPIISDSELRKVTRCDVGTVQNVLCYQICCHGKDFETNDFLKRHSVVGWKWFWNFFQFSHFCSCSQDVRMSLPFFFRESWHSKFWGVF